MDVTSISRLMGAAGTEKTSTSNATGTNAEAFQNVLQSAMNMLKETNQLTNNAEQAAIDFALGKSISTHEVSVAQQKALTSLQYTVAVRNAVMDAYKEIMQLQF